eukprot:TRINITY_DN273_c2_g1_i1.p1 TRINITY_DN273_c2_g1~~TRINITY_DN273_c2_g1_i1.p1  ORF type:complete len:456 (-),score=150.33 TRINITY_DN273_c2_g1_i1:78-1445(-)
MSEVKAKTEAKEEKPLTFESLGVCDELLEAITDLKWTKPSQIQEQSLPHSLSGKDIIGLAETGSGKTAAFAIPVLQKLLEAGGPKLFCLVMTPTRELAFQIGEQFEALGSSIGVKCAVVVGGIDITQQAVQLAKRPHIIVATPGRLVDHLEHTKGFNLNQLKFLIMDEADRMLSMDFEEEINKVLNVCPRDRNTYLFSATMTSKVKKLQRASLNNPVKIEVSSSKYQVVKHLVQQYVFCPAKHKDCYMAFLTHEMAGKTMIVFAGTCDSTERMAHMLRILGHKAVPLSGNLSQQKRLGALSKFKSGGAKILIATDVASRGLDIPNVDVVINYDVPGNAKDYVHRVGRTARAGRAGRAITILTQYDVEMYQRIETLIEKKLPEYPCDKEMVMTMAGSVSKAQRLAAQDMREKEQFKNSRKRGRGGDSGGAEPSRKRGGGGRGRGRGSGRGRGRGRF